MDPAQEHLREQKALWNKSTTDLIAKIIAFKRGLNGRGDPRVGLPPSNIKEPLPSQVGSYLNQIASDYTSLVDGAERIIQEQDHYSKVRRKTMPKQPTGVSLPAANDTQHEQQESPVAAADDGLISEASWWGSQMWSRLFKLRGPKKKFVVDMMRAGRSFRKKLLEAENYLTSSDPNSVPRALHIISSFAIGPYKTMVSNFENLSKASGMEFKERPPQEDTIPEAKTEPVQSPIVPPAPAMAPEVQPEVQAAQPDFHTSTPGQKSLSILLHIKSELHKIVSVVDYLLSPDFMGESKASPAQAREMRRLRESLNKSITISGYVKALSDGRPLSENEMMEIAVMQKNYYLLLHLVSAMVGVHGSNFGEILRIISTTKNAAYPLLGLRKKWLKMKPDILRDDTDIDMLKESAINHIDFTLGALDELMDVLEQTTDPDKIVRSLQNFSDGLANVFEDTINMGEYHNTHFRHEYRKHKNTGVVHMQIMERELNKIRRAIDGVRSLSSKILINIPTGISAFT